MRRLALPLLLAACATLPPPPAPDEVAFARAYLARDAAPPTQATPAPRRTPPTAPTPADETRGLLDATGRGTALRPIATDEAALTKFLETPVAPADLEILAWLRSPEVRAARERLEAARTEYRQSADLADLVSRYRSYLRETKTRVGPERSRRATAAIAPSPNIDALSGALVEKSVAIAYEELRRTIRDVVAAAERAHADAAHLASRRHILEADVALHDSLVRVARARVEAGRSTQAALLAFQSRLAALRTELEVLAEREAAVRAEWNRLLNRPEPAPLHLGVEPAPVAAAAPELPGPSEQQSLRIAELMVERGAVAVRLAETMTLPRMDLGSSRFERERAGEAGVQRGPAMQPPPRWEFGVREAQVVQLRARLRAAEHARDAERDRTRTAIREALFALDAARRRWLVQREEIVPLAERSLETTRGAYEGARAGYIELLDSARGLLRARTDLIDALRASAYARAALLRAAGARTPR